MNASWKIAVFLAALLFGSPVLSHDDFGPPPIDPVRSWNQLALQTVRIKSASDAQAARLYAMVNAAMYDAVNGIVPLREHAIVPSFGAAFGNRYAAAAAAAHAVLAGEYPDQKVLLYDPQLASDLAALPPGGVTTAGRNWGAQVGAAVRTARADDGSTPNETQPAGSGPGVFRAAWSGVQFRNLLPFGIASSAPYVGAGQPALTSLDYAATFAEVKVIGSAANVDAGKLATFQFWSLGGGTSQPPGAWMQVAIAVTDEHPLPLASKTRLFALVSIALADTVAPTVMTKFTFRHWRPATAIREGDLDGNPLTDVDAAWSPRAGGIGTSPEYWSGHSSFSAAGAAALAGFYCADNISFTLLTDSAPGAVARTYPSFSAAAKEAGVSRVLGGIHFNNAGNEHGLAAGRAIAQEILANKLLLRLGPTHFGECPR